MKRFRRRLARSVKTCIKDFSVSECRLYAYYFYVMCQFMHENYPDEEKDDDYLQAAYAIFVRLARQLKVERTLERHLEKVIRGFVKRGIFTVDENFSENELVFFDHSKIPYLYKEDKDVDRIRPYSNGSSLLEIYLFRCFFANDSNEFLLPLIANFLISKEPLPEPETLAALPPYLKKSLSDTRRLDFVSKAVGLSKDESKFLLLCYRLGANSSFTDFFGKFGDGGKNEICTKILGISKHEFNQLILKNGKLRSYGFIDEECRVEDDFMECVQEGSMQPYFYDLLKEDENESGYSLASFNVNENTRMIMSRMLKSDESVSLLLYGKSGSGKTEFAKSLARENGLKPYLFKNESELDASGKRNVLCRLNCLLSMTADDCVYIIDEADTILRTRDASFFGLLMPNANKGTVNKMLEESKNKIIWIVNFTSQMDESTLRRFTYSYRFESMTRTQLRTITASKLKPLELPSETNSRILDLIEHYKVTGASVDNVVKTIRSLGESGGLVDCVQSVLKENALLLNGKSRMRETVNANYDLSVLNASMQPAQIVRMVQNAKEFAEKQGGQSGAQNGIRMLFYGVSGTGKTEFARYIAEQLGNKILLKRASDILSKWVGESEQNIRDAFEEAERTESILLFDEADSFFASRESAQHSWERTQVNEFLTQMEEFSGILICTTNLKDIMDAAMNRRFHIIAEFKPMNESGIHTLLSRFFGGMEFGGEKIRRLERMHSVTPGDFGVLASRIRFMDESERTEDYIFEELCKIQDEKQGGSRTIGFCG